MRSSFFCAYARASRMDRAVLSDESDGSDKSDSAALALPRSSLPSSLHRPLRHPSDAADTPVWRGLFLLPVLEITKPWRDHRTTKKAPLTGCTPDLRCLALSGSVGMVALDLRCPTRPTRPTRPIGMSPLPLSLCLLFLLPTSLIAFITQGLHMFHFLSHYCRRSHFRSAFSRLGVILLDSVLY